MEPAASAARGLRVRRRKKRVLALVEQEREPKLQKLRGKRVVLF